MHIRQRHIDRILLKRSKIFPVLGVLGARQVGKSTFLMNQWQKQQDAAYITFDERNVLLQATKAPAQLLTDESQNQNKHLIIDEAHKVPYIFDSIKALVDKNRRVGSFTLSGSVEFSSRSGVRESLAGRIGITKLYPLTLRELNNGHFAAPWVDLKFTANQPLPSKAVTTYMQRGGMPTFCSLSDVDERISAINSWLETICYRDLKQLEDGKYNSELAYDLITHFAVDPYISIAKAAAYFNATRLMIQKHLTALESLFLLYKIPAFSKSFLARPRYYILDAGVYDAFRFKPSSIIDKHASLICLIINEIYAQYEYSGKLKPKLYYYRTSGGAEIDLVLETREKLIGIECMTSVDVSPYKQRGMKSFLKKYPQAKGFFVAPVQKFYKIGERMYVVPWNCIG